jgi:hypothetical protein
VRAGLLLAFAALVGILLPFSSAAQSASSEQAEPGAPLKLPVNEAPYTPITGRERFDWFVDETVGPEHVAAGVVSAAYYTALDDPQEYRGTWEGFGKRFGVREAGVSLSNAMEASLGSLWGEDPRYFPARESGFGRRLESVFKQTFLARYPSGSFNFAPARYAGIVGNNFISNSWRPPSEATAGEALTRAGWGFLVRMGGNAFDEFWPDAKRHLFRRKH